MKDKAIINSVLLTSLVICGALQLLIVLVHIYNFIPIPLEPFLKELPLKLQKGILPEREMSFYRIFLVAAVAGQVIAGYFLVKRSKEGAGVKDLGLIAMTQGLWLVLELFGAFKMYAYPGSWWAHALFYGGFVGAVLSLIFWPELKRGVTTMSNGIAGRQKLLTRVLDVGLPLLVLVLLWVPDMDKALARIFVWDQFRNWDQYFMMPGVAYLNGSTLNGDVASAYGVGVVALITQLAKVLGGFDQVHVLAALMSVVVCYYWALYGFLRTWYGNVFLAAFVVLAAVKTQMFHAGISPLIWISPQDTAVRHILDVPVLFLLLRHVRTAQGKYLALAAVVAGLAMAYVLSTGLCLLAALYAYLGLCSTSSTFKDYRNTVFLSIVPWVVMLVALFLVQGHTVFQGGFWGNMMEPLKEAWAGVDSLPIWACLRDRQFFAFFMGFVIPIAYVGTLMVTMALKQRKALEGDDIFIIPVAVYGLSLYIHYPAHASTAHYYAVGIPFFMVVGFLLRKLLQRFAVVKQTKILLCLVFLGFGALVTNTLMIYYPNVLDVSRLDWGQEKAFYKARFNFDKDVSVVKGMAPLKGKVAMIGSFEAEILRQADRQPFFYHAPIVSSHRPDSNVFVGTSMLSGPRLIRTLRQLEQDPPSDIFIEKGLLNLPPEFSSYYPYLNALLEYIKARYEPSSRGQYYIVMHKK